MSTFIYLSVYMVKNFLDYSTTLLVYERSVRFAQISMVCFCQDLPLYKKEEISSMFFSSSLKLICLN